MNFESAWPYASQADATSGSSALYHTVDYDSLDPRTTHSVPPNLNMVDNTYHYPSFQASPSASPTNSDYTTSSGPIPQSTTSMQSSFGYHVDRLASRSNSFPPARVRARSSRTLFPGPDPPVFHETFEVETGEEEVFNNVIHRLSDEEKRGLNFSPATRPTFFCLVQGCNRFLLHRAQVKPHLADHGYRFKKPYACHCGAEFGRQVEAARHVEDKKACEKCHRSGRKYKGGTVCLRCLRHNPGN